MFSWPIQIFYNRVVKNITVSIVCTFVIFVNNYAAEAKNVRKILILYSFDDLLPWQEQVRAGLQERLDEFPPGDRPQIYEERFDSARLHVSDQIFTDFIRAKYASVSFDAVVAESAVATGFLLAHPELFESARRYAIDPIGAEAQTKPSDVHLIATQGDWATKAVNTIAEIMPQLNRIVAVVDHSPVGDSNKQSLLAAGPKLPASVTLDVWDDFTFDELFHRAAQLGRGSAILYSPVFEDRLGARQLPRVVIQNLTKASSVPVFAHHDTFIGTGIVGGRLLSSRREGHLIADLALGRSNAEQDQNVDTLLNPYIFDDAALKRWSIGEDRLPSPHTIQGRHEPAWYQYRLVTGATVAAFIVEGLLILWLVTALRQRKAAIGAVIVERDGLEKRVSERTSDLLAATRRLEDTNARLVDLASTDALTAVPNRRKFLEVAEVAFGGAQRSGRPLSFLMLDIDKFKSINDRCGHAAGDDVIRTIAQRVQAHIRSTDTVGRLGGEEFAILLPDTHIQEAAASAERIRDIARSTPIIVNNAEVLHVTVSIGVSTVGGKSDTLKDLAARADGALYKAKNEGRDRVVATPGEPRQPAAAGGAATA